MSWRRAAMPIIPAGQPLDLLAEGGPPARFHWIRKLYEPAPGCRATPLRHQRTRPSPPSRCPAPRAAGPPPASSTRRPAPRHACQHRHLPARRRDPVRGNACDGARLYVLEGKAVYRLNRDWVEVEAGDFMWLRAYLPAGLLCRRAGAVPLPALQGRQPPRPLRGPGAFGPPDDPGRGSGGENPRSALAKGRMTRPIPPTADAAFAPFGDVLDATGAFRLINAGLCQRHHDRAPWISARRPRRHLDLQRQARALPYSFDLVERHPGVAGLPADDRSTRFS
jgi:hypothetical protein